MDKKDKDDIIGIVEKAVNKKLGVDPKALDAKHWLEVAMDNPEKLTNLLDSAKGIFSGLGGIFGTTQQPQKDKHTFSDEERLAHADDSAYISDYLSHLGIKQSLTGDSQTLAQRTKEPNEMSHKQVPKTPKKEEEPKAVQMFKLGDFVYTPEEMEACSSKMMIFVDYLNSQPAKVLKDKMDTNMKPMCDLYKKFKFLIDSQMNAKQKNYLKHFEFNSDVKTKLKSMLKHQFLMQDKYWNLFSNDFEQLKKLL